MWSLSCASACCRAFAAICDRTCSWMVALRVCACRRQWIARANARFTHWSPFRRFSLPALALWRSSSWRFSCLSWCSRRASFMALIWRLASSCGVWLLSVSPVRGFRVRMYRAGCEAGYLCGLLVQHAERVFAVRSACMGDQIMKKSCNDAHDAQRLSYLSDEVS